jgi:hypothetical protein
MKRDYTRKEFLGLGLGLASLAVAGCGDDGAGSEETGGPGSTGPGTGADDDGGTPSTMTNADDDGGNTTTGPGAESSGGPADSSGGPADSSGGPAESSGSGDGGSSSGGAAVECSAPEIDIDLHPHELTIPEADVIAGVETTYTLGGGHMHELTLTADDFAALQAGETIMVMAEPGGQNNHPHTVTITCA